MNRFDYDLKDHDDVIAIYHADLLLEYRKFLVVICLSAYKKTMMLKMVNRLISLTTSTLIINDKRISDYNINELRWNIGYVLQQIALFPHLTIAHNIAIVPVL